MKYFIFTILLSFLILMLCYMISKKSFLDKEKSSSFECGFDPLSKSRTPFSLRFFKLALIFLIFDIEIVLILPLPLSMNLFNLNFFTSINLILLIILIGLIIEWIQGTLDWIN